MPNPCYPPWFVGGQVSGWPRPFSPRLANQHCRSKSNRSNFLAHTWRFNSDEPNDPADGVGYTFADGTELYLFSYFADPAVFVSAGLPHYVKFDPFDDIGAGSRFGYTLTSWAWNSFDEEWVQDVDSRLFRGEFNIGWTEKSILEVDHSGSPSRSNYYPSNDQEPSDDFDPVPLPPFGPGGGFPWPPPDPPDFT